MKKNKKFCCYCGSGITSKEMEHKLREFCPGCDTVFYENPLPVASSIVINEKREVLLVKRKNDPYRDMWCLPIGFAEAGEEVHEAALRELKEESGVEGEIVRLIDVDTVENYYYGSLAIVTYEVKATGGKVSPGDDASDAGYFPLDSIPELAWSSNRKAIDIFIEQNRELWAMIDSFKQLIPEMDSDKTLLNIKIEEQRSLLSNLLIKLIDQDRELITKRWIKDIQKNLPPLIPESLFFEELNKTVLETVMISLKTEAGQSGGNKKGGQSAFERFLKTGAELRSGNIPLAETITALALSRKHIWTHVINKNIISSPLEIYSTLELNNRIIFIYDRINYALLKGYNIYDLYPSG